MVAETFRQGEDGCPGTGQGAVRIILSTILTGPRHGTAAARFFARVCVLIVYDGWANAIIWIEALSIGFWAGFAARRAGLHGSSLALAVLAGLIVSAIVLAPSAGEGG